MFSNKEAADNALRIAKTNMSDQVYVQAYFNSNPITHQQAGLLTETKAEQDSQTADRGLPGFSIQIGAFKKNLKPSNNKAFRTMAGNYGLYVNKYNEFTIYSIGDFKTYKEAFEAKQILTGSGISNESFIIALLNGQKIPVKEALSLIERYETGREK
jgi:hypothetical protein